MKSIILAAALSVAAASGALAQGLPRTPAPEGAAVRIISPQDGATVSSPVTVVFGLSGMGIAPAGARKENTGHHHLIIDSELPPENLPVPTTDKMLHYGGGQTEATVELEPGEHTLQLLLADYQHIPHDPPIASQKITVTVE